MVDPSPQLPIPPAAFPVLVAGSWFAALGLTATLGGWRALGERYRAPDAFRLNPADRFRCRSVQMRAVPFVPVNYNGCMTVGIADQGLYLVPLIFFRALHPPLLIPWREITGVREGRFLWSPWSEFQVRGAKARIRVYGSLGQLIRARSA